MFTSHSWSAGHWQGLLFRLSTGFRMQVSPAHLLPLPTLKDHRLLGHDLTGRPAKLLKLVLKLQVDVFVRISLAEVSHMAKPTP